MASEWEAAIAKVRAVMEADRLHYERAEARERQEAAEAWKEPEDG